MAREIVIVRDGREVGPGDRIDLPADGKTTVRLIVQLREVERGKQNEIIASRDVGPSAREVAYLIPRALIRMGSMGARLDDRGAAEFVIGPEERCGAIDVVAHVPGIGRPVRARVLVGSIDA